MAAIQWRTGDGSRGSIGSGVEDPAVAVGEGEVSLSPLHRCTSEDESHSRPSLLPPDRPNGLRVSGEGIVVDCCDHHDSSPQNNNSATHYDTLPPARRKVVERSNVRHSFRHSIKRRSIRLLKNLKTVRPVHLKMSSHTKQRNIANLAVYPTLPSECCLPTCIDDNNDIDKGEVVFFFYSDDGSSYKKETVPICNAGCPKHRIRWRSSGSTEDLDDKKSHHGDDYDSGGEFGDCDDHQLEEVLADYSVKEAPVHASTLGRLPSNHSFEAMSTEDFNSSFAYCETEQLNTIRRSTMVRKNKSASSTSLNSTGSRKNRFVSSMNKKMSSKAWPLRSLWLFLTRQKDDTHRKKTFDFTETMESATRYIRIASHFDDAFISVNLKLQRVQGASQYLRSVQTDLITTAVKAFFTIDDDADVAWVDDVPREIQRHLAFGDARVHFPVPDIRQCVACLLLSPDAAVLLRRRECVLLKSIAEVLECREECLVVMQTRPGMESTLRRSRSDSGASSSGRQNSTPPSPPSSAVSSLEWMTYIPSFSS